MYGNIPGTPQQKECDEELIQSTVKQFGSRKAAGEAAIQLAWEYYNNKHDPKTAMKRFNQAWLLDPSNADAYYGFGFLVAGQGKNDEAIKFYKKALELNPKHAMAMCHLALQYYKKAYQFHRKNMQKDSNQFLNEALFLYEEASQYATIGTDLGYIYYLWAVSLTTYGDYAKAWEKIKLSQRYDGRFIEPSFIPELSKFMPEPN